MPSEILYIIDSPHKRSKQQGYISVIRQVRAPVARSKALPILCKDGGKSVKRKQEGSFFFHTDPFASKQSEKLGARDEIVHRASTGTSQVADGGPLACRGKVGVRIALSFDANTSAR
jgi:hypothetical protein